MNEPNLDITKEQWEHFVNNHKDIQVEYEIPRLGRKVRYGSLAFGAVRQINEQVKQIKQEKPLNLE